MENLTLIKRYTKERKHGAFFKDQDGQEYEVSVHHSKRGYGRPAQYTFSVQPMKIETSATGFVWHTYNPREGVRTTLQLAPRFNFKTMAALAAQYIDPAGELFTKVLAQARGHMADMR